MQKAEVLGTKRHRVTLATLLAQPKPPAHALLKVAIDIHAGHGTYPGKIVNHHANGRSIEQASNGGDVNAVEKLAGFAGRQYRRFALLGNVFRPTCQMSDGTYS